MTSLKRLVYWCRWSDDHKIN